MLVFDVLGFVDSTRISTLCLASLHSVFVTRTRLYLVFTVPNMYVTLFVFIIYCHLCAQGLGLTMPFMYLTLCLSWLYVHHLLSSMYLEFRVYRV